MGREFTLFDTMLGSCGVAWDERGLTAIALPRPKERQREKLRATGAEEADPPTWVRRAILLISRHLARGDEDLRSIPLSMEQTAAFHRRVYRAARAIGPGRTLTYGELAKRVKSPKAARAVGQALARNPFPVVVPCHRVLASGGG